MKKNIKIQKIILCLICIIFCGCEKINNNINIDKIINNSIIQDNLIDELKLENIQLINNNNNNNFFNIVFINYNDTYVYFCDITVILYDSNEKIIKKIKPYPYCNDNLFVNSMGYAGLIVYLEDDIDISEIDRISIIIQKDEEKY